MRRIERILGDKESFERKRKELHELAAEFDRLLEKAEAREREA